MVLKIPLLPCIYSAISLISLCLKLKNKKNGYERTENFGVVCLFVFPLIYRMKPACTQWGRHLLAAAPKDIFAESITGINNLNTAVETSNWFPSTSVQGQLLTSGKDIVVLYEETEKNRLTCKAKVSLHFSSFHCVFKIRPAGKVKANKIPLQRGSHQGLTLYITLVTV